MQLFKSGKIGRLGWFSKKGERIYPVFQKDLEKLYQQKREELRQDNIKLNYLVDRNMGNAWLTKRLIKPFAEQIEQKNQMVKFLERERRKFKRKPPKIAGTS